MLTIGKRVLNVRAGAWGALLGTVMICSSIGYARGTGGDPPPATLTELLDQAEALKADNQWDEALTVLREVIDRRAEDELLAAEAQLRLGKYRLGMAMPDQAEVELRKVASDFPNQNEIVSGSRIALIQALMFQNKDDAALNEAASVAANASHSPAVRAWAHLLGAGLHKKRGEIDEAVAMLEAMPDLGVTPETATPIARGILQHAEIMMAVNKRPQAVSLLEQAIATAPADDPETKSWARVRLAELYTHESRFADAIAVCDAILGDHAAGRPVDEQAAWALIWKARSRMLTDNLGEMTESPEQARMAAALAMETGHPSVAYEAQMLLGEICGRLGAEADRLVKEGGTAYSASPIAPLVEDTRREQNYVNEGEWGPLTVEAMEHYGTAMDLAAQFRLGREAEAKARLQYGMLMRHLGMGDKAIATLRMGLHDPSQLTETERSIAQVIGSFLGHDQAEAWRLYLIDPSNHADPTAALVAAEFDLAAPEPSSPFVTQPATRLCWLGDFYMEQRRYDEALWQYQNAESTAQNVNERAEARTGQIFALRRLAHASQMKGDRQTAGHTQAQAEIVLENVRQDWTQIILTSPAGHAHYGLGQVARSYGAWQMNAEGLQTVDAILLQLESSDAEPAKIAYGKYVKMDMLMALARYDEAVFISQDIDTVYSDSDDPVLERIRVLALMRAAQCYARLGQAQNGYALIDSVAVDHPEGTFDREVEAYRSLLARYEN